MPKSMYKMISASKKSPIDSLLTKNLNKFAESARIKSRRSSVTSDMRYMLTRTHRVVIEDGGLRGLEDLKEDKKEEEKNTTGLPVAENNESDHEANKRTFIDNLGLSYLGLAPKRSKPNEKSFVRSSSSTMTASTSNERNHPNSKKVGQKTSDQEFSLPLVFECDYCTRFFFCKELFRRHRMKHLKFRRCLGCSKPFADVIAFRRHRSNCQKILY